MKKYIILILTLLQVFFNIYGQKKIDGDFRFPLDIPANVSGSFGELRSSSFHAGIDFTTNQTVGQPVYAVEEGYIARVFVSSGGYGKAVYIDHPGGHTTVYAHLDKFSTNIEKFITDLQYKKESFNIDHYFNPNEMPVKKGELIGKSGNSGNSGGPHLHFEIRETASQRPLNPHFMNFPIKDNVPPIIEAICIYPMDDESDVNGKNEPLYLPIIASGDNFKFKNNIPVSASGLIGIGVEVTDHYSDSKRRCGVYSIILYAENQNIFESRLDALVFDNQRYMNSHIDYERKIKTGKSVQKSFVDINNKLNIYKTNHLRGAVEMIPDKIHVFKYEITDPAGNISIFTFQIKGVEKQPTSASIRPMKLSASQPYTTEIDDVIINIFSNTFYTDVPAIFSVEPNNGIGLGSHVQVLDETIPVHKNFEISIPIPDELKNTKGLCGARINNDKLVYAVGKINADKMVISTREGGTYTLTADSIPPSIKLLNPPQGRNYSNQKEIRVEIKDNFSGIKSYRCTMDGKWQLFEYDAKNNVLIGYFDKMRIEKGKKYLLEVKVTDNLGNEGVFSMNIVSPD